LRDSIFLSCCALLRPLGSLVGLLCLRRCCGSLCLAPALSLRPLSLVLVARSSRGGSPAFSCGLALAVCCLVRFVLSPLASLQHRSVVAVTDEPLYPLSSVSVLQSRRLSLSRDLFARRATVLRCCDGSESFLQSGVSAFAVRFSPCFAVSARAASTMLVSLVPPSSVSALVPLAASCVGPAAFVVGQTTAFVLSESLFGPNTHTARRCRCVLPRRALLLISPAALVPSRCILLLRIPLSMGFSSPGI